MSKQPYSENKITPMVKLIKHEEASKAFGYPLFYAESDMWFDVVDPVDNVRIYVPRGYLTDGATVPKLLQGMFPVWDDYYQAALFHDYLCEYLVIYVNGVETKISRSEADKYFNIIMKHLNIGAVKRNLVYNGVRFYSHLASIIYPSATVTKRKFEDEIRVRLSYADKAKADQKKKTA